MNTKSYSAKRKVDVVDKIDKNKNTNYLSNNDPKNKK